MKSAAFAALLLLAACATPAPEYVAGTQGRSPDQLAVLNVAGDEVKVLSVDGQAVPGSGTSEIYLAPGARRVGLALHWCPGGLCTTFGSYADQPRTACFDAKAGSKYRVAVRNPGPNWEARVTELTAASGAVAVEATCR